jgi:surface carbohydrate biosynthesis protein
VKFTKILNLIRYLLKAKLKFLPPKKRKILIFDGISNPFHKYLKKKDYNILYRRGEELNLFIILNCILKLSLKSKTYYKLFIKYSNPKIILTAIDNSMVFYQLKSITKIPTISIQNTQRTYMDDLTFIKKVSKKKSFSVDYMLTFNERTSKDYQKYIFGNKIVLGSFLSNSEQIKNKKSEKKMLLISTHKPDHISKKNDKKLRDFYKNDDEVIKQIHFFCEKNQIPLCILGRNISNKNIELEKEYFARLTSNKVKFLHNFRGRKNFEIMDKFKYLIAIEGTLGIENLSRGGRSGFIFNRPNNKEYMSRRYGALEGLKRKGPFWTSYNDKKEFIRVCKYLVFASEKSWKHSRKKYASKVMTHDKDNKKFLNIINKILNENKN